jgi:hypothetical protein
VNETSPPRRWPWILLVMALGLAAFAAWYATRAPVEPVEAPPAAPVPKPARRASPPKTGLHRPKPKPCKKLVDEGGELVMSQGLDETEIRTAMNAFLPNALRCVPEGWTTSGTIDTRVTVGCDGVVDTVEVLDGGGFPSDMVRCVKETIGYAPFPAHDQPDGMVFEYPVRLSF